MKFETSILTVSAWLTVILFGCTSITTSSYHRPINATHSYTEKSEAIITENRKEVDDAASRQRYEIAKMKLELELSKLENK